MTYLMHFLPPLQVLDADHRTVMQQGFTNHRVGLVGDRNIQWGDPFRVLVVGRGPQFQQSCDRFDIVVFNGPMHGRSAILGSEIQDGATVHQVHEDLGTFLQFGGESEGRFWKEDESMKLCEI